MIYRKTIYHIVLASCDESALPSHTILYECLHTYIIANHFLFIFFSILFFLSFVEYKRYMANEPMNNPAKYPSNIVIILANLLLLMPIHSYFVLLRSILIQDI